jgi:transcriptional regulator with XRE-family HTH domain
MEHVAATALGDLLRTYREQRGLTQAELVALVQGGISVDTISNIERGRTRPQQHTLQQLMDALGLGEPERRALLAARQQRVASRPAVAPALATAAGDRPAPTLTGLPTAPNPLVGREHVQAVLAHLLLRMGARLLTPTGPGGVGKTRLAIQVAHSVREHYAGGVAFVDLVPLREERLVAAALAAALGARVQGRQSPREALVAHLCGRQLPNPYWRRWPRR